MHISKINIHKTTVVKVFDGIVIANLIKSLEQFQHFWLPNHKSCTRAVRWMLHRKTSGLELCMICTGQESRK